MDKINRILRYICVGLIFFGIFLSAKYVLKGDIYFHTDIARDFVLMQEMVSSGRPSLIGAKIGPIQGLFHGPLWLYLNLPAFILGHGNPVVVGWGWVVMGILFLVSTYFIVKEIFSQNTALLVTLFLSSRLAFTSHQLFNPSGAIMLTPLIFYLLWKYLKVRKPRYLVYLSLILGCTIQFEAAYGVPITLISFLLVIIESIKIKKYFHFLYLSAIAIPLSTYLVFDIRHNFIQFNSLISYITSSKPAVLPVGKFLLTRFTDLIDASGGFLTPTNAIWQKVLYMIIFFVVFIKGLKVKNKSNLAYYLFGYIFFGFWLVTYFYPGKIESFYYAPLQILSLIIFASGINLFNSIIVTALLTPIIVISFLQNSLSPLAINQASSWQYNLNLGKSLYEESSSDFGYFVLSEDLLAYSPKYAISYAQRFYSDKKSYLFTKKPTTYVLISRDTYKQGSIDVRWWEEGQVRIAKTPVSVTDAGYYSIKKYQLSASEISITEDPNLLQGIEFR